jgi:hypothetical protein
MPLFLSSIYWIQVRDPESEHEPGFDWDVPGTTPLDTTGVSLSAGRVLTTPGGSDVAFHVI